MAHSVAIEEFEALTRAFSGFGVDEKSIITVLSKWHPEQRKSFWKSCPQFFKEDDRFFERWEDYHISILEREFADLRCCGRNANIVHVCKIWPIHQKATILCTLHPSERDARLVYEVIHKGQPLGILIEVACTRSSEELLGARRAYHSLFNHSLEEDVASHVRGANRSLLVALVSSYRYEGTYVKKEIAGSEAKTLGKAIKEASTKKLIENEYVVRILSTRSKLQLKVTFDEYKEMFGEAIDKDLEEDLSLQETVQCLSSPPKYFSKTLDMALKDGVSESTKEALTRVIVTRTDVDMKEIKEEYQKVYGVPLAFKIEEATCGNYRDFLLALAGRSN